MRCTELTAELKMSVSDLEAAYGGDATGADPVGLGQSIAAVQTKVALWVERIVVLSDKMANFQDSYNLAVSSLPAADASEAAPVGEMPQAPEETGEFSFESLDGSRTVFAGSEEETAVPASDESRERGMFGAITPDERGILDSDKQELADEKEKEPTEQQVEKPAAQPAEPAEQPAAPSQPAAPERIAGFETFSRPQQPARPERVGADVPPNDVERTESSLPGKSAESAGMDDETVAQEEKVIDLYALGAVDYDPAVHG